MIILIFIVDNFSSSNKMELKELFVSPHTEHDEVESSMQLHVDNAFDSPQQSSLDSSFEMEFRDLPDKINFPLILLVQLLGSEDLDLCFWFLKLNTSIFEASLKLLQILE
mmetsp:Transcript_14785/g.21124  ORF Transcript_14785/g.21124 Transcript_14785/m.21124 type:complete len:110 (+) Transcript_14785:1031-1360(+)